MRELRNIVIFSEVANCKSFSKAAKNLHLTPSGVSMSVQKLESILGTRLLTRTTRQLHLTADGATFLQHAEQGLNKIYEAVDLFENRRSPGSGLLRVSVPSTVGKCYIMPALPEFMAQFPDIDLQISFTDQVPDLVREKLDLGLCYGDPEDSSYVGRYLCAPPMTLVASPSYLATRGSPASPEDLDAHRIINVHLGNGRPASWQIKHRLAIASQAEEPISYYPKGGLIIIDNHESALDAAATGMGIALVVRRAALPFLADGKLVQIMPDYEVQSKEASKIFLLYPSKQYLAARVRAFIDFLVEVARRDNWDGGRTATALVRRSEPRLEAVA